ncbi:pantetheine-phosphate adenylyltransferase [candidate division WOR-3 bacterium]|nr:pantetheine-phosphate adenylyltransferase [candidate division WOR-3 bacterium]
MDKIVVYAGTFDPITNGHLDIMKRAVKLFKKLVILVVAHTEKSPLFSLEERMKFIQEATKECKGIEIDSFDGLLMDYMKKKGANIVIRGLRAVSDFDYEFQLAQLNRKLYSEVETVFVMPSEEHFFLSSSMLKEIASYRGDVSLFVPKIVSEALKERFCSK